MNLLCKIEVQCLARPHKILVKTIGEVNVHILGYTNAIILWIFVFGYNTLLNVCFRSYLTNNVHRTFY
jgi:hypothetical protein